MLRTSFILLILLLGGLAGCREDGNTSPDIQTSFPETFPIRIYANQGVSEVKTVDLSSSEHYNDFKGNIGGFEVTRLTYRFSNTNVPEDMLFSGTIICSNEENTESYSLASISKAALYSASDTGTEYSLDYSNESVQKLLAWLDSPGKFNLRSDYRIQNPDGSPYEIGLNAGSNFLLQV